MVTRLLWGKREAAVGGSSRCQQELCLPACTHGPGLSSKPAMGEGARTGQRGHPYAPPSFSLLPGRRAWACNPGNGRRWKAALEKAGTKLVSHRAAERTQKYKVQPLRGKCQRNQGEKGEPPLRKDSGAELGLQRSGTQKLGLSSETRTWPPLHPGFRRTRVPLRVRESMHSKAAGSARLPPLKLLHSPLPASSLSDHTSWSFGLLGRGTRG